MSVLKRMHLELRRSHCPKSASFPVEVGVEAPTSLSLVSFYSNFFLLNSLRAQTSNASAHRSFGILRIKKLLLPVRITFWCTLVLQHRKRFCMYSGAKQMFRTGTYKPVFLLGILCRFYKVLHVPWDFRTARRGHIGFTYEFSNVDHNNSGMRRQLTSDQGVAGKWRLWCITH